MLCQPWNDETQAYYQMESFGKGLGQAAAIYISDNILANGVAHPGACALECVLESLDVSFTMHQIGPELRFIIVECPFEEIAGSTGLPQSELAHVGINALCQSLLEVIQPELPVSSPIDERVDHIFAMNTQTKVEV
jgi:hypothetical protein